MWAVSSAVPGINLWMWVFVCCTVVYFRAPRSLSDLGNRSEHGGRARTNGHDFEAHSGPTQRKIRGIWAALPAAQ